MSKLNLRKRGNKWEYRFEIASVGGKRKQVSKGGFALKADCLKAGTEAMNNYNKKGYVFMPSELSYSDYLDYWIEHYCKNNVKQRTLKEYQRIIKACIKPTLGKLKLSLLRTKDIQEFVIELKEKGLKKNSVSAVKSIVSNSLEYAINPLEYIEFNPCSSVRMPKFDETKKERHIITYDEFSQLCNSIAKFEYTAILTVLYFTGMRIGEVLGLRWSNIDFNNNTITTKNQVIRMKGAKYLTSLKNKSSERTIPVNSETMKILRKFKHLQQSNQMQYREYYMDYYLENGEIKSCLRGELTSDKQLLDFVFVHENGNLVPYNSFRDILTGKSFRLFGKSFHPHQFRHSHASRLVSNLGEGGMTAVQKRLGHSSLETTMSTYLHSTEKMEKKLVEVLENIK